LRIDVGNLLSGLVFIAIGGWFAASALVNLPLGTPQQMGPGLFPLALAGILVALGAAIAVQGWGRARVRLAPVRLAAVPWRGAVLILIAPVLFGALLGGLGLAPAVFVAATVSCFASRRMTLPAALSVAFGLALLCALVFKLGLGIAAPLFGRWLGA
jgi:hypothetical protein